MGPSMTENAITYERAAEFTVFLGILTFLSGIFCVVMPHVYAPFFDHYVGWLFLLVGTIQFVHAYASQHGWALVSLMLLATVNVVMGGMILNNPYTDILGLVLPIAVLLVSEGIFKILLSFALSGRSGWTWFLMSGLMACLMGSLVYAGLPTTSFWVLGLLFGVNLITTGIASFFATLMQQRQGQSEDTEEAVEEEQPLADERMEPSAFDEDEAAWPETNAA